MTKQQAIKKIQIAIDKMIDLQDDGFGNTIISDILDKLNEVETRIENGDINNKP